MLSPAQERGNQILGANFMVAEIFANNEAGGLLYPSPAANLVSAILREELAF